MQVLNTWTLLKKSELNWTIWKNHWNNQEKIQIFDNFPRLFWCSVSKQFVLKKQHELCAFSPIPACNQEFSLSWRLIRHKTDDLCLYRPLWGLAQRWGGQSPYHVRGLAHRRAGRCPDHCVRGLNHRWAWRCPDPMCTRTCTYVNRLMSTPPAVVNQIS